MMNPLASLARHSRLKRTAGLLTLAATALLNLAGVATAAEAPPEPKVLIEKSIEGAGGREKMLATKSVKMSAALEIPQQKIKGTMTMQRKPGKVITTVQIPGIGKVQTGVNGDVAYESTDLMGARLLDGTEKKQALDGMDPNALFARLTDLKDATVTGPETIGNAQTWKLSGKNLEGDVETHWFDTKSWQAVQSELVIASQMGKVKATVSYADFKTIGGMLMPMKVTQSAAGMQMVITIDKVEINPELPDSLFALPEEVQGLVDQAKASTTQPAAPAQANP